MRDGGNSHFVNDIAPPSRGGVGERQTIFFAPDPLKVAKTKVPFRACRQAGRDLGANISELPKEFSNFEYFKLYESAIFHSSQAY
jgi:hypothetical protein